MAHVSDCEVENVDGIGIGYGKIPVLVCFDQSREDVELVAVGSSLLGTPKPLDLAQGEAVIVIVARIGRISMREAFLAESKQRDSEPGRLIIVLVGFLLRSDCGLPFAPHPNPLPVTTGRGRRFAHVERDANADVAEQGCAGVPSPRLRGEG